MLFPVLSGNAAEVNRATSSSQASQPVELYKSMPDKYGIFTDGNTKLVCVGFPANPYAFWNPDTEKLTRFGKGSCQVAGLKQQSIPPIYNPVNFGRGATIRLHNGNFSHCSMNFESYYTLTYSNDKAYSFYILGRLNRPTNAERSEYCEDSPAGGEKVSQQYGLLWPIISLPLPTGKTALLSYDPANSAAIKITRLPEMPINLDNKVFFIPRATMAEVLRQAGSSLQLRYKAVLRLVQSIKPSYSVH